MKQTTKWMIGLATLAILIVPSASAANLAIGGSSPPADRCNGLIEDDGCTYWNPATGSYETCRLWVAGNCVRGG